MMRLNRLLLLLLSLFLFMVVVHCSEDGEKEKADFLSQFDVKSNDDDVHTITFTQDDGVVTAHNIQFPRGELTGLLSFTVDRPPGELTKPDTGPGIPTKEKKREWLPSLYTSVRELPVRVLSPPIELWEFTSSPITYEWKGTVGEAFDGPMKEFPLAIELVSNSAIRELCAEDGAVHISGMDWNPDPNFPLEMVLDVEREQEKHSEIYKHCHLVSWILRETLHSKWYITYHDMRHSLFEAGVFDLDAETHQWLEKEDGTWWITPHGKGDPILFYDLRLSSENQRYQIMREKLRDLTVKQLEEHIQRQNSELDELSKQIQEMAENSADAPQTLISRIKEVVEQTNDFFEQRNS
jgi:hypothetical protein